MMESIKVCLLTYGLAAVVSMFVAFLIHMLCILIKKFAKPVAAIPAAPANVSQQGGEIDLTGKEVEIAIAIAAAQAYEDRH